GTIVPDSGTPPSMMNFSMSSTRRRLPHEGALTPRLASVTAIWALKFALRLRDPPRRQTRPPRRAPAPPTADGASPAPPTRARLQPGLHRRGRGIGSAEPCRGGSVRYVRVFARHPSERPHRLRTDVRFLAHATAGAARARSGPPGPLVPIARGRLPR